MLIQRRSGKKNCKILSKTNVYIYSKPLFLQTLLPRTRDKIHPAGNLLKLNINTKSIHNTIASQINKSIPRPPFQVPPPQTERKQKKTANKDPARNPLTFMKLIHSTLHLTVRTRSVHNALKRPKIEQVSHAI